MPVYDYKCNKCKKKEENVLVMMKDIEKPHKCECGEEMVRLMGSPSFYFRREYTGMSRHKKLD